MLNEKPKQSRLALPLAVALKPAVIAFLCAGLISAGSELANAHPEPSVTDSKAERVKQMTEKRNLIRAKSQKRTEEARERAAIARENANKSRELQKEKSVLRRLENEKKREIHLAFKTELLTMLQDDGVISSEHEAVEITYNSGHPILNDIDLSARFGDKYENLWAAHDRLMSDSSYLNISDGSYELREITKDGASHHFVMQTGSTKDVSYQK